MQAVAAEVVGQAVEEDGPVVAEVDSEDLAAAAAAAAAPVAAGKYCVMTVYVIDVSRIEELQTLGDINELEKIFSKAKSTIVNGEAVTLVRKSKNTPAQKFDELSTLEDLERYRKSVFKYL